MDAFKEKMGAKHPIGFLGEPIDVAYASPPTKPASNWGTPGCRWRLYCEIKAKMDPAGKHNLLSPVLYLK
ncbi:hypothetical protein [Oceanobacillus massiliensis]|uniref:hypothetical protein n=1 Tax=Oceanobacillus massiliensis TaxID=1465765 RepID=UPI00164EC56F|nr:hypothetical protein [Oceanobacillus massiliensis]